MDRSKALTGKRYLTQQAAVGSLLQLRGIELDGIGSARHMAVTHGKILRVGAQPFSTRNMAWARGACHVRRDVMPIMVLGQYVWRRGGNAFNFAPAPSVIGVFSVLA